MAVISMCKVRLLSPQDRRFILEVKEALVLPHHGPEGMTRKAVWGPLGRSESWYSLVLDTEKQDLPNLLDLRKIARLQGNAELMRVLVRWCLEDHDLTETNPNHMLTSAIEIDGLFTGQLAQALEDGKVTPSEARELVPSAGRRMLHAQQAFDDLKKLARRR
jgi:hypothetical protein